MPGTAPAQGFIIQGDIQLTGPVLLPDGTAAAPAYSFDSDPDTGVFRSGANALALSTGGTSRFTLSSASLTLTVPLLVTEGTAAAPGIAHSTSTNTGIVFTSGVAIDFAEQGSITQRMASNTLVLTSAGSLCWTNNTTVTAAIDVALARDAANILALRNGTNACSFRVYNTYTDTVSLEQLFFGWGSVANTFHIATAEGSVGGIPRPLLIGGNSTLRDVVPAAYYLQAGSAWGHATVNTTGGNLYLSAGVGSRIYTVIDYTALVGKTATVTVNGTATVLTEGVNWTAATSNAATATSLAAAIDALAGVSATVSGAVVYVAKDATTQTVATATNATGAQMTTTQGTDGATWITGIAGSASLPGISFLSNRGLGFYEYDINTIGVCCTNGVKATFTQAGLRLGAQSLAFGADLNAATVILQRDGVDGVLALRNGANAQTFRMYGTYTDGSNYERIAVSHVTGTGGKIAVETAGTGADNLDLQLSPAGTGVIDVQNPQDGAGAQAATLLNGPTAGNPAIWLKVKIGGNVRYIPAWA